MCYTLDYTVTKGLPSNIVSRTNISINFLNGYIFVHNDHKGINLECFQLASIWFIYLLDEII